MTIFAILLPTPQPALAEKITKEFGQNALRVTDTQWLVSATATTEEITKTLGMYDPLNPSAPPLGTAIVFATSAYFGRAPTPIWEWLKSKLEPPVNIPTAKSA